MPNLNRPHCLRWLLALSLSALVTPALAQVDASASYIVSLGNINIANIDFDLSDNGESYRLDLDASVTGLGTLVTGGSASAASSGRSTSPTLSAEEFELQTRAGGENFNVDISYGGGAVSAFQVTPPLLEADRIPIERSHLTGVTDMLASFIVKGGTLGPDLCQRRMSIFTGVERFDVSMAFGANDEATSPRTGYQGPVVLCTLDYQPISGHYSSSEMTSYLAEQSRILMWYAPLGQTGYFIPYRAIVSTTAGDLSLVLTSASF